uniref:NADH-ubiquinone oxidoreductase chain 4 n=1 Tax=Pratylenchus vulnus TaxID=45931 RepID=M1E1K8_PRAVU|nr:NADH dehydrogenase subunit 4 [Pratylenchus vulnus]
MSYFKLSMTLLGSVGHDGCYFFNFFWVLIMGYFFLPESIVNFFLCFLALISLMLVLLLTYDFFLMVMGYMLFFISVFFFYCWSFFFLFIFFELSIIPIFFMSLGYGVQVEKLSSLYFFGLYSFLMGLPFLLFLSFFFQEMSSSLVFLDLKMNSFLIFFISVSFLMKIPIYFLHFWLPKLHVEASTLASMVLAGLLLKLGIFGFMRFLMSLNVGSVMPFTIGFIGSLFGSLLSLGQSDMKAQVAYMSICHMGVIFSSFFFFSNFSKLSIIYNALSHGFLSTLTFWLVGEFFHYSGTRLVYYLGSLFFSSLSFSYFLTVVLLLSGSLPPSLSYLSEYFFMFFLSYQILFFVWFVFYFFFDFYMVIYMLMMSWSGKTLVKYYSLQLNLLFFLLELSINFFWLLFYM